MSHTRTARTAQATSSTDKKSRTVTINLTAPTSWREMSQEQLRIVFDLMAIEQESTAIKTYMLIYFCGLHVIRHTRFGWKFWTMVDGKKRVIYIKTSEMQSFIHQFDFIDQLEDMDCRLDAVCGLHAADALLQQGVTFNEYLHAEKYYQLFVETKSTTLHSGSTTTVTAVRQATGTPSTTMASPLRMSPSPPASAWAPCCGSCM